MVKRYRSIEEALDPARPIVEPTTFRRGPTSGKFLYIIAKVQLGQPLSIAERDLVLAILRSRLLSAGEYNAYLRTVKLKHIEVGRELAKHGVKRGERVRWVQQIHGFPTRGALKAFMNRERKQRR